MPTYKTTILFSVTTGLLGDNRRGGWSESHYLTADSTTDAARIMQVGTGARSGLLPSRAALLPERANIIGVRIQDVDNAVGKVAILDRTYPGVVGVATDVPQMAVQLHVGCVGVRNVGKEELRCIPDDMVKYGVYRPTDAYKASMDAYIRNLGAYKIFGVDFAQPRGRILNITDGGLVTTRDDLLGLGINDKIKVLRTTFANGRRGGDVLPVTSVTLPRKIQLDSWLFGPSTGGSVRKNVLTYFPVDSDSTFVKRVMIRKVGRPFDLYSGRRSARH